MQLHKWSDRLLHCNSWVGGEEQSPAIEGLEINWTVFIVPHEVTTMFALLNMSGLVVSFKCNFLSTYKSGTVQICFGEVLFYIFRVHLSFIHTC